MLPVVLALTALFLGGSQGNVNYLLFFVGLGLLAPIVALGANMLLELIVNKLFSEEYSAWWLIPGGMQCSILSTPLDTGVQFAIPTYWTVLTVFFFSYLFWNARELNMREPEPGAKKSAIDARVSQSMVAMTMMPIVLAGLLFIRSWTGCETLVGMTVGTLIGGSLGYGWHNFLKACGMGRLDDMFGINNRIVPVASLNPKDPKVCVSS